MSLKEMNLKLDYTGKIITPAVKDLVEELHYSHSARSQQQVHIFQLRAGSLVLGAAIFGKPICRHYARDTLELRRFVLVSELGKNAESYFLSRCLKWIEQNDKAIVRIMTYADPNQSHTGVIYRASNFNYDGEELSPNPRIIVWGDKLVHTRQAYQKKKGEYTPDAIRIQKAIASGEAQVIKQKKKLRFIYNFKR